MYSEQVMDHFKNPRNLGELPEASPRRRPEAGGRVARARCTNPICGDEAELAVRVLDGKIQEVRFRAVGCVAALASCSRLTELVRELPVERALALTAEDLMQELGGLPRSKRHGAALAVETLREALRLTEGTPG